MQGCPQSLICVPGRSRQLFVDELVQLTGSQLISLSDVKWRRGDTPRLSPLLSMGIFPRGVFSGCLSHKHVTTAFSQGRSLFLLRGILHNVRGVMGNRVEMGVLPLLGLPYGGLAEMARKLGVDHCLATVSTCDEGTF